MTKYHVALSFAGEDRAYVEQVANRLRAESVDVFYDNFEEADLWGKNLYARLSDVYQNRALFTVMFISEAYKQKLWTNHERESAQARAFSESSEYILPAYFDESVEVPGVLRTVGYVSQAGKTPEELASLIVQKLENSGVTLSKRFSYSDIVKADVDYPVSKNSPVNEIIRKLRKYTWGVQNLAVMRLLELDWSQVGSDEAFVLGRNLYQTACGGERRALAALEDLRRELAALPDERAVDLLNGMFFEVYFDPAGEFRGRKLKNRCLSQLLSVQSVKKFGASIGFIRRALEPYRNSLLFLPNFEPEIVCVQLKIMKADPPTLESLKVEDRELLAPSSENDFDPDLWRLSFSGFTLSELGSLLSRSWGLPSTQLDINCAPEIDSNVKIRLPSDTSILRPVN